MIAALCGSALTRPGAYRLAMQLRVGNQGQVTHYKRLDTSGSQARDQRIDQLLSGLRVGSAPPAGLAQPILILVLPAIGHVASPGPYILRMAYHRAIDQLRADTRHSAVQWGEDSAL
ncbi:hypothetical protein [Pollutimonas bauzanensis]|uniref:Uncharacterized protein n=1 Tax=Pollutimonas bauzanensis TaxID=658167 RepID=A0A1M5QBJ4_9BURK|nr:hypothetical protein [Pollutimonas bauzanensis]SHH10883.1 hypothetical protein SAMN04488135_102205 [Pollutimonas bauzanensis]